MCIFVLKELEYGISVKFQCRNLVVSGHWHRPGPDAVQIRQTCSRSLLPLWS